jgi:hypothetical protein
MAGGSPTTTTVTSVEQLSAVIGEVGADHLHVHAGVEGESAGVGPVGGEAVEDQFLNAGVVADDEPVEAPLALEDVGQRVPVAVGRDAADGVEGGHDGGHPGVQGCLEGREVVVAQVGLGGVHGVVVTAAFGASVGDEVLGTGREPVVGVQVGAVALVAAGLGRGEGRREVGVFAAALRDAAPARLVGDVHHRGECPAHPVGARLRGRDLGVRAGHRRVEAGCLGERDGERGPEAVDDVQAEQQRDAQPRFLDGEAPTTEDTPPALAAAAEAFDRWERLLAESLREHGTDAGQAAELATLIVAAVEGATAMCRAQHSIEPLDRIAAQLETLVAASLPG